MPFPFPNGGLVPRANARSSAALDPALGLELLTEGWLLSLDAAAVICLRLSRMAMLDAAAMEEGERMISEKALVAVEWPWRMMTGGFGTTPQAIARRSLSYYRTRVADNRRRLSPGRRARR